MYMGAIVQGLLVQAPTRMATRLRRNRNAMSRARPVWMPRSGKNAMNTPDAEGQGDPVRRVLEAEEDLRPRAGAGSLAATPGQAWPSPEMVVADGRERRASPSGCRRNTSGSPGFELADHRERQVPDHRQVLQRRRRWSGGTASRSW